MNSKPIVEVTRGDQVESVHHGTVAIIKPSGELRGVWGDPNQPTFMRSGAKPFQALPFLESGAASELKVTPKKLAMVCASHTGHRRHLQVLNELLEDTGLDQDLLQCGIHRPLDRKVAWRMVREGQAPSVLHNNCAGKHIAMLATARHLGFPLENYLAVDHPLQQEILAGLVRITEVPERGIALGTDGCSAPNFSIPIRGIAVAFARLAAPDGLRASTAEALDQIFTAMTSHPELVSGPGKLDALLMQQGNGQLLAKEGAEGVLGIGLRQGDGESLGVAIKIWDGDSSGRALAVVALDVLDQMGWLSTAQREAVEEVDPPLVKTRLKKPVGVVRSTLMLEWIDG
jgi:L-asparaginase II